MKTGRTEEVKHNVPYMIMKDIQAGLSQDFHVNAGDVDKDGSRWMSVKYHGRWYTIVVMDQDAILANAGVDTRKIGR